MKKMLFTVAVILCSTIAFSQRITNPKKVKYNLSTEIPVTAKMPTELQGCWMYGNFSTTEYWSVNPGKYLGNALQYAIAFKFHADGTYEQYFSSSSVMSGISTYHQSFSRGKAVIDTVAKTITTTATSAHYKRTRMSTVEEDRDMRPNEISPTTIYFYATATETNGTATIQLTLQGTKSALVFQKKPW